MTAKEEIFREDTLLLHIAVSNIQIEFEIFANPIIQTMNYLNGFQKFPFLSF